MEVHIHKSMLSILAGDLTVTRHCIVGCRAGGDTYIILCFAKLASCLCLCMQPMLGHVQHHVGTPQC